jgi:uncharacterized protein YndB with AHSA1/START domain
MPRSLAIEQSYYFEAPAERVFRGLTDPKILVKWFLSKAKLVPNKGGSYSFDWIGGYHMTGKVKRFETNKAVSFSWHDKLDSGVMAETEVSFKVAKQGNGTLLKLRHTGFEDPEHFAECSSRWGYYLTNMKSVLDHDTDLRSKYYQ